MALVVLLCLLWLSVGAAQAHQEWLLSHDSQPFYCLESAGSKRLPVRYTFCNPVKPSQLFRYFPENRTFVVGSACLAVQVPEVVLPLFGTIFNPLLEPELVTAPCDVRRRRPRPHQQFACDEGHCCNAAHKDFCVVRPFPGAAPRPLLRWVLNNFHLALFFTFAAVLVLMGCSIFRHVGIPELSPLHAERELPWQKSGAINFPSQPSYQGTDNLVSPISSHRTSLNNIPSPLLRSADIQFFNSATSLAHTEDSASEKEGPDPVQETSF